MSDSKVHPRYILMMEILELAIQEKISVENASKKIGKGGSYFRNRKIDYLLDVHNNKIPEDFQVKFKNLLNVFDSIKISSRKKNDRKKDEEIPNIDFDTIVSESENDLEEKISIPNINFSFINPDEYEVHQFRDKASIIRDKLGKIVAYKYQVKHGNKLYEGYLTRQEMEEVYSLYPHITRNTLSNNFLHIPSEIFPKVLNVFKITKTDDIPPHLVQEYQTQSQILDFKLKSKEKALKYNYNQNKKDYFEKLYYETLDKYNKLSSDKDYYTNIIEKMFSEIKSEKSDNDDDKYELKATNKLKNLTVVFSDIHIGKRFDSPIFGRGYNLEIAKQRLDYIAQETINYIEQHKIEKLNILFLGDLLESMIEGGFHHGQYQSMENETYNQFMSAYRLMKDFIKYILSFTSIPVYFTGIGGNHDRLMMERDQDIKRTGSKIVFSMLEETIQNNRLLFDFPESGIIMKNFGKLCFIAHHGDTNLNKRQPIELVNQFGSGKDYYHIVLKGHFHAYKVEQGTNFMSIQMPSVCSPDNFIQNQLGLSTQPGFLMITESSPSADVIFKNLY